MCWRGTEQGAAADEPARFRLFTGATVITFYLSLSYYGLAVWFWLTQIAPEKGD